MEQTNKKGIQADLSYVPPLIYCEVCGESKGGQPKSHQMHRTGGRKTLFVWIFLEKRHYNPRTLN